MNLFSNTLKKIFALLIASFVTQLVYSQKIVLCDSWGGIYNFDPATCGVTQIPCPVSAFSIAMKKDTLYIIAGSKLYRQILTQSSTSNVEIMPIVGSNAMTIDENGMIYVCNGNELIRVDPYAKTSTSLGRMPYSPSGDLMFYKKKLYMAAQDGIVEVDLNNPSKSYLYVDASNYTFFGLINVPDGCNGNKVYAITTALYEIDMENKKVLAPKCTSLAIGVYDAASITENGYNEGVNIDSLYLKNICLPATNDGSITVKAGTAAIGATLTYTLNGASPNGTGIYNNLIEGTYALKVTSSNGCFKDTNATLVKGAKPDISIISAADTCANNIGSVTLASTIGNTPIRYSLDNGPAAGGIFTNLSAKKYQVQAITNIGCTLDSSFEIVSYKPPTPLQTYLTTPEICDLGSITLTYSNAVKKIRLENGPDTYVNFFQSLKAKMYAVSMLTDYCTYDTLIEVKKEMPEAPVIAIAADTPTCFNSTDGVIRFTLSGKYAPFTMYANGNPVTGTTFSSLGNGTYKYSIKDRGGCMWDTSATILYTRIKPATTTSSTEATCWTLNNGSVTAIINGKNQPYTFDIFNSLNNPSGSTVKDLNSRVYNIFIADKNKCVVDTVPVTVGRIANNLQIDKINTTPAFCNSPIGTISFEMTSNAGQIIFTMNNGLPTPNKQFTNLISGTYSFKLKDLNDCTADTSADVIVVNLPSPIKELKTTPLICERKGGVLVELLPGKTGSDYQLDNGTLQSSNLFANINDGLHQLRFVYSGCPFDTSFTIAKTTTQKPTVNITNKEVDCYNRSNGTISVRVSNGAFPYTFSYNNAAYISDANIYNLAAGNYTIRIKDSYGCLWDTATTLKDFQVIKPVITPLSKTPVCFVDERATLQVFLNGPQSPYNFIVNGASHFSGSEVKLLPGMYNVYVNNNTGCLLDSITTDLSFSQTGALPCDTIVVPTAFTPNNDSRNDVLRPRGNYGFITNYSFSVFNRLGENVFQSTDMERGWNGFYKGQLQPLGTYVWILNYKTKRGQSVQQKGTAVLMR